MFPWQSGSDGQEETQELNLNHRSQRWIADNSFRQRHVGSAVAYNAWQYFRMGYASAMALVLMLIILALTIAQFVISRKWVYYEYGSD